MRIVVAPDAGWLGRAAAGWVAAHATRSAILALAVGASVETAYRELASRPGVLDGVDVVTLDELHPLPTGDTRAFGARLVAALGDDTGARFNRFDATCTDPEAEAIRMDQFVRARGLAACVLGLGPNGHLALNEPGVPFDAPSRFVPFRADTLEHLGGRDAVAPATGGMTLSLPTLLAAESILLVVDGKKQDAAERLIFGPLTTDLPASVLRMHPDVTLVTTLPTLGTAAASVVALPGVRQLDTTHEAT